MDEYPEYRFACSQAQQYEWIKRAQPGALRAASATAVRAPAVRAGRRHWIEPDCNIPSGESLVRQFLYGQRFFEREFGRRCSEFWNPDVFGYNGQLPQIMRGAGIDAFPDPEALVEPVQPAGAPHVHLAGDRRQRSAGALPARRHLQREATRRRAAPRARATTGTTTARATSLLVFGYGDGGGGPTARCWRRCGAPRDLQGLPRTRASARATSSSRRSRPRTPGPAVVVGELYFEYHRGTYTSQARVKRGNRALRAALHDAEFLSPPSARRRTRAPSSTGSGSSCC